MWLMIAAILFDVVVTTTGARIEGKVVRRTKDALVLRVRGGTLEIPLENVARVIESEYDLEEGPPKPSAKEKPASGPETAPSGETPPKKNGAGPPDGERAGGSAEKEKEPEAAAEKEEKKKVELTPEEAKTVRLQISRLGDNRPHVRRAAGLILLRLGEKAVGGLLRAARDGNMWRRMNAARLLGELKADEGLGVLLALLNDTQAAVRAAAHAALVKITGRSAAYDPEKPTATAVDVWRNLVNTYRKEKEEREKKEKGERGGPERPPPGP